MPRFTRESILEHLDECVKEPYCFFMDLQHGYFHTANSRLSLFADEERWAIVFEKSGFGNRSLHFELELNYFGNSLCNQERAGTNKQFVCNAKSFELSSIEDLEEIEDGFEQVSNTARRVKLRGKYVALPATSAGYAKWFPDWDEDELADRWVGFDELCRYLAIEYEDRCRATMQELRTCLPGDLPFLMHIDAWHHRYHSYFLNGQEGEFWGEKPSSYETFPLIADVLVSRDPRRFRPTLAPNTHWSMWPEAGRM